MTCCGQSSKEKKTQTYLDLEEISRLELAPRLVWNFATTSRLNLPSSPTSREKSCWTFALSRNAEERAATKAMTEAESGTPTEMASARAKQLMTKKSNAKLQLQSRSSVRKRRWIKESKLKSLQSSLRKFRLPSLHLIPLLLFIRHRTTLPFQYGGN